MLKTYFFGFQKNPCEFLFYISIIVFLGDNLLILYGEITTPPPPPPHTHSLTLSSHHPLNQSHAELKTVATSSPAFSRASSNLLVFILSSDWFLLTLTFDLTGRCDYFSLEFM